MQWGRKGLKGALNSWKQMLLSDQIASNTGISLIPMAIT